MSKTDNNEALITLLNKIIDCCKVRCRIQTKQFFFKDQTKPWIFAIIKHNTL